MSEQTSDGAGGGDLPTPLPAHVAIIMDGNGRWARERGLPRTRGHEAGAVSVRRITEECARLGLEQLTLYAFSTENWSRPRPEVSFLMRLYRKHLVEERKTICENNVRFTTIGRDDELPGSVRKELATTVEASAENTGMLLCLALNYSGRQEIVDASRRLAARAVAGEIAPDDIDEETFAAHLFTAGMPDPDLLIRTAGECRVSNFLLWEISYAEFYIEEVCWPDFTEEHLHAALRAYGARDRRFGGLSS